MSILSVDLNDEKPVAMPEGLYEAKILDVQIRVSQNSGNNYLNIRLGFDDPNFDDVYDVIMLPTADLSAKGRRTAKRRLANFLNACGIPSTGQVEFDTEDLIGKSVEVFIGQERRVNEVGEIETQNRVIRYKE